MNKLEIELERNDMLKEEYQRTAIKKTRKMHALLDALFGDEMDRIPASGECVCARARACVCVCVCV